MTGQSEARGRHRTGGRGHAPLQCSHVHLHNNHKGGRPPTQDTQKQSSGVRSWDPVTLRLAASAALV